MLVLGIGSVLQKDDGIGIYAAEYLDANYYFADNCFIVKGGVEGIGLLDVVSSHGVILILDSISITDEPATIYAIPSHELGGFGLNSGGAHEIGILQCMDMMELMGRELPDATILGIVPDDISFGIALSQRLIEVFDDYINVALKKIESYGIEYHQKESHTTLASIINKTRDPSS